MVWTEWQQPASPTNSSRDGQGPFRRRGKTWKLSHLLFPVEQNTRYQFPLPREDCHYLDDSKDHHYGATRNSSPNTPAQCTLVPVTRVNAVQSSAAWDKLYSREEKKARSAPGVGIGSPWPAGPIRHQYRTTGLSFHSRRGSLCTLR